MGSPSDNNPLRSRNRPRKLHPRGDIYGGVRLPAYRTVIKDSTGERHPIDIEGRFASCSIHGDPRFIHSSLTDKNPGCEDFVREWHNQFVDPDHTWKALRSSDPPSSQLALNVLATMVKRIQRDTEISPEEAVATLRAFPELQRDPDWLSGCPDDMSLGQWAIHKRYQNPDIDLWVRSGDYHAVTFANAHWSRWRGAIDKALQPFQSVSSETSTLTKSRYVVCLDDQESLTQEQLYQRIVNNNWHSYVGSFVSDTRTKKTYHNMSVSGGSEYDWPLTQKYDYTKGLISRSGTPVHTMADAPVESHGHIIQIDNQQLRCAVHNDYWCKNELSGGGWNKSIGQELGRRVNERVVTPEPVVFKDILFDWTNIDLADTYVDFAVQPWILDECLALGLDGPSVERWMSLGVSRAKAIALAMTIAREAPDLIEPEITTVVTSIGVSTSGIDRYLAISRHYEGISGVIAKWMLNGATVDEALEILKTDARTSGVPGTSVPRPVPRKLSISQRLDSLDFDTLMELAVDLDWGTQMDEPSQAAESLADTTLSIG